MSIYSGGQGTQKAHKRVTCFCSMTSETSSKRYQGWQARQLRMGWSGGHTNCMSDSCYSVHWDGNTYMWPLCGLGFCIMVRQQDSEFLIEIQLKLISFKYSAEVNFFLISSSWRLSALKVSVPGKKMEVESPFMTWLWSQIIFLLFHSIGWL